MMDWLGDWLKQVILIILLASFVDLLLPSQAMQKYVRTVVSLFLLLTLLTPVFELFQRGWDAEKLLAEAEQTQSLNGGAGNGIRGKTVLQPLAAVLASSEELKADNAKEAKRLAEQQLSEQMKAGLEQSAGLGVTELQVNIDLDQKGTPVIGTVQVVLSHKEKTAAASPPSTGKQKPVGKVVVEPVKPVTVAVDAQAAKEEQEASGAAEPAFNELRSLCILYFEKEWQVSRQRLSIRFDALDQDEWNRVNSPAGR
jgi:stage III sporulation protein AF